MKPKSLFIHILAALFVVPFTGAFAQQAGISIDIVETFNYPAGGVFTRPQKINDNGEIAGVIDAFTGERRGFVRYRNGHFTPPIIEPNDTANFTDLRGINNSRLIDGGYVGSDGFFHGFFLTDTFAGQVFTQYDVPGATNTLLLADNNAGDFVGGFTTSTNTNYQAFVSIGGTVVPISIPDATISFAYGINATDEVVGQYTDTAGIAHGFFRDAAGTVTAPIDPAGSTSTVLFGLNDRDLIVGRFTDVSGVERGFLLKLPDTVAILDKPGATLTSLNGINNQDLICGRFEDARGAHGIVARVAH